MEQIIIASPSIEKLCFNYCSVGRQNIFVISKKNWNNIKNYYKNDPDVHDIVCECYTSDNDFVECCQIIDNNPSDSVMEFVEKICDNSVIDLFLEEINKQKLVKKRIIIQKY